MKKVLSLIFLLVAFATASYSQCAAPNANYKANSNKLTINETDRGAMYHFYWGSNDMIQTIGMFGGGRGALNTQLNENSNSSTSYLWGGLQDGDQVSVYKICGNTEVLVISFTDNNY